MATGILFIDTPQPDIFQGGRGIDTVDYSQSLRPVIADLARDVAYKQLRILPLGDSITYGVIAANGGNTESGGYRKLLADRLSQINVSVNFVGSQHNGPGGFDSDHDGYRGWTLNQLTAAAPTIIPNADPDVVFLIGGTNDSLYDSVATMISDLRTLINKLSSLAPEATILVASVPPIRVGGQTQARADKIDAYNDQMPALIDELAAAGRHVSFVDMRGLSPSDITGQPADSGLHPTAAGYAKIADYWYSALQRELALSDTGIGSDRDQLPGIENLIGSKFDDQLIGGPSNNVLAGGGGNDQITGGAGTDTAQFSGSYNDYSIATASGVTTVTDKRQGIGNDGTDSLTSIELLKFSDLTFNLSGGSTQNKPPLAAQDGPYLFAEDVQQTVQAANGVLSNDADPEGGTLTAVLTTNAAHGALTLNANGSFGYRGALNYNGTDTFTYAARDSVGASSSPITVQLKINPVNDAPVTDLDSYAALPGRMLTVGVQDGVLVGDSDVDGDSLTAALRTNVTHGSLLLKTDGSFTYAAAAGFEGSDSFEYVAKDASGDMSAPTLVTIAVGASTIGNTVTGTAGDDVISTKQTVPGQPLATEYNDTLTGLDGDDQLDGGAGADRLVGGIGDDTYIVNAAGDATIELSGSGTDEVWSTISWTLGDYVEYLVLKGTMSISGTGNSLNNVITGNSGSNVIDGAAGADRMAGRGGDDVYVVDNINDKVVEYEGEGSDTVKSAVTWALGEYIDDLELTGTGKINGGGNSLNNALTGNSAANTLNAWAGTDILDGKLGNDTLTGGQGADTFVFSTAPGTANIDQITDFAFGEDTIALASSIFGGLGTGALSASAFKVTNLSAVDAGDRVLYNSATGALSFDSDGSGSAAAVQFATLATHPSLSADSFIII